MKRFATCLAALVCAAAGVVRWLDLAAYTDPATGFVTYGPVWARYAVGGGVLAVLALASLLACRRPMALARPSRALGAYSLAVGTGFTAYAGAQFSRLFSGLEGLALAQAVLYLLTGLWFFLLATSQLSGGLKSPTRSAAAGLIGTLSLYLLTVVRFGFQPSGIVRIGPTVEVFSALAALLFCAALVKLVYLRGAKSARWLHFAGLAAFFLCTCLELPQTVFSWQAGEAGLPDLCESGLLALLGLLGAGCSIALSGGAPQEEPEGE